MAVNLVSVIAQFLNPDLIARLASALGIDGTKTLAAAGAAVPGLLSGLLGTAAQPGGPERLTEAINREASQLDGLSGMLGESGQTSTLVDTGSRLVTQLLGDKQQSALTDAIGKFSGLGESGAGPLLGALGPMVLGVIGKQAGPGGFDPLSLVSLLSSQKENIAKAMPAGLGNLLQGSGLLDSLGGLADSASSAAGAASAATDRATQAAAAAASQASRAAGATTRSGMGWVAWALPLVLVLGIGWLFLGNRPVAPPTDRIVTGAIPVVVIRGVDVSRELGSSLSSVSSSLESVTDAASAQAVLPDLAAAGAKLETIKSAIAAATPEQKAQLAEMIGPAVTRIEATYDKVTALPGVSDVLKPAGDEVLAGLRTLIR